MTTYAATEAVQALETPFVNEAPGLSFAEGADSSESAVAALGFTPWTENESPFSGAGSETIGTGGETQSAIAETYAALRDEAFNEALAGLAGAAQDAVSERFADEHGGAEQRERMAESYLAPVELEAEEYLQRLTDGLSGMDVESLTGEQLDEVLDRLDHPASSLTPAGEEFIGSWVNKAKDVVKTVVKTAKKVGSVVGRAITAALQRLRKLLRPLLKRVLAVAIGRLPAQLQPAAKVLAGKLGYEAELENESTLDGASFSPAIQTDLLVVGESFDLALAEVIAGGDAAVTAELESFGTDPEPEAEESDGRELELLAEARANLLARLQAAQDGEDLAPVVEQFVPALLPALRVGIRLAGRPKVVSFLARYLDRLIRRWVGPQLAGPLSSAIVDTGLRLITLESPEPGTQEDESGSAVLAATIEDTVRRFAENEDYVFEDEDLTSLALAESFQEAVAATFPAQFVRNDLQLAPSLGGSFVTRHPRSVNPYRKYSRIPEVHITPQLAAAIRVRGGTTLAAVMKAAGLSVPGRYRLHIFEAVSGTSLRRIARRERAVQGMSAAGWNRIFPLSPQAAAALVREPRLGSRVPRYYLRSPHRVAVGQRFFYLEPATGTVSRIPSGPGTARGGTVPSAATDTATQAWMRIDLVRSSVLVTLYISEADAQETSAAIRQGRGVPVLLKKLVGAYDLLTRSFAPGAGRVELIKEMEEGEEFAGNLAARIAPNVLGALRSQLRAWVMSMLAEWVRERAAEFERAASDPRPGVTVSLTLTAVPGLHAIRQALAGRLDVAAMQAITAMTAFAGKPSGSVTVVPGLSRA